MEKEIFENFSNIELLKDYKNEIRTKICRVR